mgnify:CR=1 FL=1
MPSTQAPSPVERFVASLEGIDVAWSRTDANGLESTLESVLEEPAVGVPIPIDGASLPDSVETDFVPETVRAAATGVTPATIAVADYGSVLLESDADGSELASLFSDTHVPVIREQDIVGTMADAFEDLGPLLRGERGDVIVATGPSATSDMGTLVTGVHGPTDVHVIIVEQ